MMPDSPEPARGFAYALGAYVIWGLVLPLYMKALAAVSPVEIVAHRVLWALPFGAAVIWRLGLWDAVRRALTVRTLLLMALTATLISANWGIYVYAIVNGHGVEAALGYYINPLTNVLLAALFLGERPNRAQGLAIALATLGVLILTVKTGGLPWISLGLALTFGSYGLLRKTVPVGASEGFFLEVSILFLPALALALAVAARGEAHFAAVPLETALLVGAGPLTAVPLILYAAGARLLRFMTISLLQYLTPTALALTAIFVFGEPFGVWQGVAFACIWAALAVYTGAMLHARRRRRAAAPGVG